MNLEKRIEALCEELRGRMPEKFIDRTLHYVYSDDMLEAMEYLCDEMYECEVRLTPLEHEILTKLGQEVGIDEEDTDALRHNIDKEDND